MPCSSLQSSEYEYQTLHQYTVPECNSTENPLSFLSHRAILPNPGGQSDCPDVPLLFHHGSVPPWGHMEISASWTVGGFIDKAHGKTYKMRQIKNKWSGEKTDSFGLLPKIAMALLYSINVWILSC